MSKIVINFKRMMSEDTLSSKYSDCGTSQAEDMTQVKSNTIEEDLPTDHEMQNDLIEKSTKLREWAELVI